MSWLVASVKHVRNVCLALFLSSAIRLFIMGFVVSFAAFLLLDTIYPDRLLIKVVNVIVAAMIPAIGGLLWLRQSPETFDESPTPAFALFLLGAALILALPFELIDVDSSFEHRLAQVD